jgi:uncharacterized circularly permuted ATP-grasp superfamily protein/uncharacterized alpha-E superfamily protein
MPRQLLAAYPQEGPHFDEMLEAPLKPRPHWERLFDHLVGAPAGRMRNTLQSVERQVYENGITYNVYADPQGLERPWELDVLPFIISPEEWSGLEAAIAQRATLLNRILADVYGPQELLREGRLPPALIHGHAGFLRPARGLPAPDKVLLHIYAADLARSPDGRWWVIADRTQAPSGAGYALENRLVISRVFPELFRDLKVQHLADFFRTLRDSLAHWAPHDDEAPLVVLLTPGPYNETYFEHAYLARYLGFPLVEGSDLTVRDGCVWLKTLTGLQRVHVVLRRQDDDFCDPLELRSDSALGIAGLTDAARRGNVLIANALGSNLLESGALLGFLPGLCRHLLGEKLRMPSVATWWCGEPAALEQVINRLDKLVIKAAYPQLRMNPLFGEDLDDRQRTQLVAAMRARPHNYVAQELVRLSQAPVWDREHPRRLQPRSIGLRVYACASPNGYVVMPGGLTRVSSADDSRVLSMQRGGSSKDTWVLSNAPVSSFSLLRRAIGPQDLVRSGSNLSSRVVENLFWFGRYAERCDATARLLRVALTWLIDDTPAHHDAEWPAIISLCRARELLDPEVDPEIDPLDDVSLQQALIAATLDESVPHGLAAHLRLLFRVAFHLRERLSLDNWRTLNRLMQEMARHAQGGSSLTEVLSQLDRSVVTLMTLAGFTLDGMTRDQGWRFLSIGRRLERLQSMSLTLSLALAHARDRKDSDLDWLLEVADSIITYRSRYMSRPEWLPVLDLLVLDESNPRSLRFQILGLYDYLVRLSETFGPCEAESLEPLIARLHALDAADDLRPGGKTLPALLADLQRLAHTLSDRLSMRFFSHVSENRQAFSR